jgi:hypothetical protein
MRFTNRSVPGLLLLSLAFAACGMSVAPPTAKPESTLSPVIPSASVAARSVVIDGTLGRSVALPWPRIDARALAVDGSRAYYLEYPGKDPVTGKKVVPAVYRLHVADLADGTTADVVTLDPGHMIASGGSSGTSSFGGFVATPARLFWVEIWYDRAPNNEDTGGDPFGGLPQHWQVVSLDLADRARSVVASGTNHRVAVGMEGAAINPPVLAVDGDRVAYTVEATAPDAPNANEIVLRSLADGSVIRRVTTKGLVPWIGLAGNAMAYREALGTDLDGMTVRDARLMIAATDARSFEPVDDHVGSAAITADRLVWGRIDATDGSAWTRPLLGGSPVQIAGPTDVGFRSTDEPGIFQISASGGFASWLAVGTVNGSDSSFVPFIWASGDPAARLLVPSSPIDTISVSGDWLTWNQSDDPPLLRGATLTEVAALGR